MEIIINKQVLEAALEFKRLQDRIAHPDGSFDSKGRWHASNSELQDCCAGIRVPSASYPYSQMTHCRTATHVALKFKVVRKELLQHVSILESIKKGVIEELIESLPESCTLSDFKTIVVEHLL